MELANIYSGMTSAQKDNERKYLSNLVSGGGGNAEWAKGQLKQLDASGGSSSTSTTSSSGSKNKGGSSYETWESGGRSYVNGIDIGPAGTKVDTSDATVNAAYSGAYSGAYGNSNKYGDMGDELKYNPYEEQYNQLKEAYKKQEEMLREQNRLAVEQGTNRLNAQKSNINQAADENARQAYVQYMQSQKALPQQLAVQGASGGATETAQLGLQTNYQNNVNSINQNKANRLQEIDNAIVDLQNTGDLSTVEQVLANNQAALDAYMNSFDKGVGYNQWANQFNANRQDTAADLAYRDKVYADNMAQQQLENEWYERNYNNSKKQEETNRVISLLENGMVDANYASTLLGIPVSQLNEFVNYINKARNLELSNTQSLINNRNQETQNIKEETVQEKQGNQYYDLATQINNQYVNNATGKNAGEAVIVDNGNGGYMINPNISRASYLDLVIARAFDSNMSDNEVKTFLNNLGISDSEISRVAAYYLK
jgi:hypothetical protein